MATCGSWSAAVALSRGLMQWGCVSWLQHRSGQAAGNLSGYMRLTYMCGYMRRMRVKVARSL